MQYLEKTIKGIDKTSAELTIYSMDDSAEIDAKRLRPVVLILPGGGYEVTSDREAEPVAMKVLGAGYNAAILRYSCYPSVYPVAMLETAEVVRMLRKNAEQYHIDANAVIIAGFSAGAHLAADLATSASDKRLKQHGYDPDEVRPNGLMLAYPVTISEDPTNRSSFDHLLGKDKDNPDLLREVSIEKHIDRDTPPTFIWQTVTDELVPVQGTMATIQAYIEAGASVEVHLFPSGVHGLSLASAETAGSTEKYVEPGVQIWFDLFVDWVKRNIVCSKKNPR